MSTTAELKKYLLEKENAFLLDEKNNGKTIMLSGAWGAGKTHFWQNEIEPELSEKLKTDNRASIYVSLYGKDNINSLKQEIYLKAHSEKKLISEEVSTFGLDALSGIKDSDLFVGKIAKAFADINKYRKANIGTNRLKKGGVICLDDFERKSKNIDLNDLFGFISQLSIDLKCKVVIILNADVFTGKEAEVFKTVKEKTVNKFFYFEPTIKELFESIAKDEKYSALDDYKEYILNAIKETEELNARIYIQVLDNCLEWLEVKKNIDEKIIRVLVLGTFNFILNHLILDYQEMNGSNLTYKIVSFPHTMKAHILDNNKSRYFTLSNTRIAYSNISLSSNKFIEKLKEEQVKSKDVSSERQVLNLQWIDKNEALLKALWKYGYRLYFVADVDKKTYNEIAKFIKTGILI